MPEYKLFNLADMYNHRSLGNIYHYKLCAHPSKYMLVLIRAVCHKQKLDKVKISISSNTYICILYICITTVDIIRWKPLSFLMIIFEIFK